MFYYVNLFFIYSFLGFLFENFFSLIINSNFNSGILYGPWTFIYGFAIFVLIGVDKVLKDRNWNKWGEVLLFFIIASSLMTFIEYLGGILIENIFHIVYWDYTNMNLNYGSYICLEASIFWGLFATIINYLVTPHLKKFAHFIPKIITIIVTILFLIDIIITFMNK